MIMIVVAMLSAGVCGTAGTRRMLGATIIGLGPTAHLCAASIEASALIDVPPDASVQNPNPKTHSDPRYVRAQYRRIPSGTAGGYLPQA